MVSPTSIAGMITSAVISIFLPVALLIFFLRRNKISLQAVLIGVLVFAVTQVVVRIPLLNWMSMQEWYQAMFSNLAFLALCSRMIFSSSFPGKSVSAGGRCHKPGSNILPAEMPGS